MTDPAINYLSTAHEIARAKRLGTYGQTDRSKQYEGRYSPEALLKSDNHLWKKLREMEQRKFRRQILIVLLTAALARAPEIWHWVSWFMR